jgi:hypothetical protein
LGRGGIGIDVLGSTLVVDVFPNQDLPGLVMAMEGKDHLDVFADNAVWTDDAGGFDGIALLLIDVRANVSTNKTCRYDT